MTVWSLGHGTGQLGYGKETFLLLQMAGILCFAAGIPISARWGDRGGTAPAMMIASVAIIAFGLLFAPLFVADAPMRVLLFLSLGFFFMGLTYGPCGTLLAQLYPVQVRYTGASLSFNLAGILGAAPAPYIASALAQRYGLAAVGAYLAAAAALSLVALALARRYLRH
jgi:MFS family permease